MLPTSHHSHPYSTHRNNIPNFLYTRGCVVVESLSAPQDCAIIATDEHGNIKYCNGEAQHIFHCLPSYAQDKELDEILKIAHHNHARYAPTLWELAHSTHRPLAFPELDAVLPGKGKHPMNVCSVWLHEEREEHSQVAFIFSTPVMKMLKSPAGNRTTPDVVQADIEEGIIVLKKHTIIETSRSLNTMLGYKEGELIGRDISSLLSNADVTTLMYAAKTHNTQMFQGLAVRRNDFLESVRFRCFPSLMCALMSWWCAYTDNCHNIYLQFYQSIFLTHSERIAMKPNMGTLDRSLRILSSFIIIGLYFTNQINGTTAIILLVVAGVFIVTSFLSFCPLYLPFGFSTKQKS